MRFMLCMLRPIEFLLLEDYHDYVLLARHFLS